MECSYVEQLTLRCLEWATGANNARDKLGVVAEEAFACGGRGCLEGVGGLTALAGKSHCREASSSNLGNDTLVACEERVGGDDGSAGGDVVIRGELVREAAHVGVCRKTGDGRGKFDELVREM